MLKKNIERIVYLFMLGNILFINLLALLFTLISFLIPKTRNKDILFFPYCPKDNPGTIIRFQNYLKFFDKDNITYDLCYPWNNKSVSDIFECGNRQREQYFLYTELYWKRLFQVLTSGNYKAVYIQRGLFPYYPDQKFPHLERLSRKLNNNITIDFYDADYTENKELVNTTVKYCDKITVVNAYLFNYFSQLHANIFELPLALEPSPYLIKKDYSLNNPIKLFWSGSKYNAKKLKTILHVLRNISVSYSVELILICPEKVQIEGIAVSHYQWNENTFYKLMQSADISIYPALEETETNKGKMALKVLEYMASALPIVASPWGISPYLKDKQDILIARDLEDWKTHLEDFIQSQNLREKIGQNAYWKFHQHHTVENSYKKLKTILFS